METDGTRAPEIDASMVREAEDLTQRINACAIEVHRHLGPGLLESAYEGAMCVELSSAGVPYECQVPLPVVYKGHVVGEYRIDLIVDRAVVVELKSVERFDPVFEAQVLTYLRVTGKKLGLLINFGVATLKEGFRRLVNDYAPASSSPVITIQ